MQPTALLIKVTSIQQYIFSSNKLKENIGASHIIEHELFQTCAPDTTNAKKIFIGGGKAMYKFTSEDEAKAFLNAFSRNVLSYFPGIQIGAAMDKYDRNKFKETLLRLSKLLKRNKSYYPSMGRLPKEGVFADCPQTNEYQEVSQANVGMISNVSKVKFDACQRAQEMQNDGLNNEQFEFTDEIELLGQQKDKGYIAVVHIDGNNIGQQFNKVQEEDKYVELSNLVRAYGNEAMDALINDLIKLFSETKLKEEIILEKKDDKLILPIRPILTGGDDITFVCEGRLGIYLAEQFINHFENIANQSSEASEQRITACAGVTIVKTKFPFFKAYKLAEELCHEAKKNSRAKGDSWISFHSSSQGVSGNLKAIRAAELKSANGRLTANPYSLDSTHINALSKLKNMAFYLKENWPMNKIMELRDVVKQSESSQALFKKELEYRGRELPDTEIWDNAETKYWDAILLLDFYPQTLGMIH